MQYTAFDSHFKSLRVPLLLVNIEDKDMKTFLPFSSKHGEDSCVSGIAEYHYSPRNRFAVPKNVGPGTAYVNVM